MNLGANFINMANPMKINLNLGVFGDILGEIFGIE